jgi:mannosyltransferase
MSKIVAVRDRPEVRHGQANNTRVAPMQVSERHGGRVAEAAPAASASEWWSVVWRSACRPVPLAVMVAALTVVGVAIRLVVAGEPLFADELSTYWIVTTNSPGGVLSTVSSDAEISPPLPFLATWLTTQIDGTPELVRAPAILAGAVTIPAVYLLGLHTVGRAAALVATAFVALAPFTIYYSAEGRGYGLMMAMVVLSTLAMLRAVDTHRARWWVVYAVCSCAAVYSHYTSVFVLGAQFLWLLWAHPDARRPALLANIVAAVAFLPWVPGLIADFNSPTTDILAKLQPFDVDHVLVNLEHWSLGHPGFLDAMADVPGTAALVLVAGAGILALTGFVTRARANLQRGLRRPDRRVLLILALALSTPVGAALFSAVGTTSVFSPRNLAASWPALALAFATLLVSSGPRFRVAAVLLAVASFVLGAAAMLDDGHGRPDYRAAAGFIDGQATPGDVVIDAAVFSPGPYSPLDVALQRPHRVFRAGVPEVRDRPFQLFDRRVPDSQAVRSAIAAADGRRIFVVSSSFWNRPGLRRAEPRPSLFRPRYRLLETRSFPGGLGLLVKVWGDRNGPRG